MVIETRFDLNDKGFVIYDNKVYEVIVTGITIETTTFYWGRVTISYEVRFPSGGETKVDKSKLFASKEELIKTL